MLMWTALTLNIDNYINKQYGATDVVIPANIPLKLFYFATN